MISWRNFLIRKCLQLIFKFANMLISFDNARTRKRFHPKIEGTPAGYEDQRQRLEQVYAKMKGQKYWAQTSGTRKEPKLIPYDRGRTKLIQKTFIKGMITLTSNYPGQKTFFVFSSLDEDNSLTSGLLENETHPGLVALLQAPYRYLQTSAGKDLRLLVGNLASRVILLLVSQPRFFYATNPSTLTHFLDEYENSWDEIRQGLIKVLAQPKMLESVLTLADGPALKRLHEVSLLTKAPLITDLIPELKAIISWDGGYVSIFLKQLKKKMPLVDFIPMFSMSTEALETIPHIIKEKVYFLPTAPETYAEFLDLSDGNILAPGDVTVGKSYTLLITDKWGLLRYDTQDIFLVKEMVEGLPDLRFIKRRGVTSSLTGEKITEEQAMLLSLELKNEFPSIKEASFSLFPLESDGKFGYRLAMIGGEGSSMNLSKRAEEIFGMINTEYASKVNSGRLQALQVVRCSVAQLAGWMGKENNWESQFKILPLYEKIVCADK